MAPPLLTSGSFLVLALLFTLSALPTLYAQSPTNLKWPGQTFQTFNWSAPVLSYTKTATTAPGVLFFAPIGQDADKGDFDAPTIMTDEGELIWRPESDNVNGTRNFGVQSLNGTDVLTYWTGDHNSAYGLGYGAVIILDTSYGQIYNVCLVRWVRFSDDGHILRCGGCRPMRTLPRCKGSTLCNPADWIRTRAGSLPGARYWLHCAVSSTWI